MADKKINVTKTDSVKDIIAQLIEDDTEEVALIIPKFSKLAEAENNFKLLKKAAGATGKKLTIESVDDQVVQLAKAVELEAFNPFFANDNNQSKSWKEIEAELDLDIEKGEDFVPRATVSTRRLSRRWLWLAAVIVLAFPLYWLAFTVLPRAEVMIITKKTDWRFNDLVAVEKDGVVPTQVLLEKKNAQITFPAAGKKVVSQKAGGKITVFNAFSSEPQQLVATTRFVTEEGRIYRLVKSVTIPGAKVEENKITPSLIAAEVSADKPGADYNIGPGKKLTIPGFKGSRKYAGFYGESGEISGGKIGEVAYPTDDDIKKAKDKVASVLREALALQLPTRLEPGSILVEGAQQFSLTKATVNPETNEAGEFSVIAEGETRAVVFREKDLLAFLENKMKAELGQNYTFKNHQIKYDVARVDFGKVSLSLPVDFSGTAYIPVDVAALRQKIAGKSKTELKDIVFALPGLDKVQASLWPIYVNYVPDQLKIIVD